jgi:NADPH-dependent 2,4-dienoyl-CoA reductase/sulfur reductase-like enzyme
MRSGSGGMRFVAVNETQQTSVPDVLCAGEPTGIGGVEKSLFEGAIAGHAAARALDRVQNTGARRRRVNLFSTRLATAFSLRQELRSICLPDTLVCRCEDVSFARICQHPDWRSAKLQTRCGMGPCQGRICGSALAFLKGWQDAASPVRPPIYPASLGTLVSVTASRGA